MKSHSPNGDKSCDTLADRPRVNQLRSDSNIRSRRSSFLKLTDECHQALSKAIEMNWPVRIISTKEVKNSLTSDSLFLGCHYGNWNGKWLLNQI